MFFKALAQATTEVYRVLTPISNESEQGAAFINAIEQAICSAKISSSGAMGQMERLPALAQELIEAKVDVLSSTAIGPRLPGRRVATRRSPTAGTGDAVLTGLVESFAARPAI